MSSLPPPRDNSVDDSSYWCNRLTRMPPDFELRNEQLHVQGACALGNALSIDTHLIRIIVGPNKITEKGATGLADGISRNRGRLNEFIILDGNEIGPGGCAAFLAAVKKNPRIRSFSIYDRSIGNHGEIAVARTLQEMGPHSPHFEGFPLSKYCSIFGLSPENSNLDNRALLEFLRSTFNDVISRSGAGAVSSNSDKYDADDYDDANFKTVSLIDGSHLPYCSGCPKYVCVPAPSYNKSLHPHRDVIHRESKSLYVDSNTRTSPDRYSSRPIDAVLGENMSSSLKPNSGMPNPPAPTNVFLRGLAEESRALQLAAESRENKDSGRQYGKS